MNKESFYTRFKDYEQIHDNLFCKLINPRSYAESSKDLLSKPWMDLQICCYYDMAGDGLPDASAVIRSSCLSLWDVSGDKVLEDAWYNTTERQSILFYPLERVLRDLQDDREWPEESEFWESSPLYILSSTNRVFGAVFMAVPAVLMRIGKDLGTNYYILPSSIHECLILPETEAADEKELNTLVSMINKEYVPEKEVLADHVYYYDRMLQQLRIC